MDLVEKYLEDDGGCRGCLDESMRGMELKSGRLAKAGMKQKGYATQMQCMECLKKFKKKIGPKTFEVKCPKCGSFDTEPI